MGFALTNFVDKNCHYVVSSETCQQVHAGYIKQQTERERIMATVKYHFVLQDIAGQKTSTTIECVDTVTAANLESFLNTQSSAQVVSISQTKPIIISGTDKADEGSDVDDKLFLTFKSKAGDIRRWVIAAPETGFKAAWLVATDKGLRVTKTKGDAFATSLSTALGLTGNDVLIFQSGFYKHTK